MKKKTHTKRKTEEIYRIDFDTLTREIIEIYELSPDGTEVRTSKGWVPSTRAGVITQRPPRGGLVTKGQIEKAVKAEQELLKEKKFIHTAAFQVAIHYPIAKWLRSEM